jgi:hypothetical protein
MTSHSDEFERPTTTQVTPKPHGRRRPWIPPVLSLESTTQTQVVPHKTLNVQHENNKAYEDEGAAS